MGLEIAVGVKDAAVKTGLAQIRRHANQFSADLKGMLMGAVGGFTAAFSLRGIIEYADKMRELKGEAARFGTGVEGFQRLQALARDSQVDVEKLGVTLRRVDIEAGKAASKGGEAGKMFKTLGIDAGSFVKLSMDQKLIVLSGAFQRTRNSGAGTIAMMNLLGARGEDILPTLAKGPEALSKGLNDATVVSDKMVDALAKVSKEWGRMQTAGVRALKGVMPYVEKLMTGLGYMRLFMGNVAKGDNVISAALHAGVEKMHEDNDDKKPDAGGPEAGSDAAENATKMASLQKQIADEQDRYRAGALTGLARINELTEQRLALENQINDTSVEGLEAKKKAISLDHEIEQAQKKYDQDVQNAQKAEANVLEKQYLAKATPAEKKKYLQDKQAGLMAESKQAGKDGDQVKAIKKRTEAESVQDEIDQLGKKDRRVTVAVDSLQRVGGGGGIAAGDQAVRQRDKTNDLLTQIKNLIAQRATVEVRDPADDDY